MSSKIATDSNAQCEEAERTQTISVSPPFSIIDQFHIE